MTRNSWSVIGDTINPTQPHPIKNGSIWYILLNSFTQSWIIFQSFGLGRVISPGFCLLQFSLIISLFLFEYAEETLLSDLVLYPCSTYELISDPHIKLFWEQVPAFILATAESIWTGWKSSSFQQRLRKAT